jgi:calcium/calmodulin-dependent 3',5'-cyclic nucleotide phosphodiesterase
METRLDKSEEYAYGVQNVVSRLESAEIRSRSQSKSPSPNRDYLERKITQIKANHNGALEKAQHVLSRTKGTSFDSCSVSPDQPKIFMSKKTKNLVIKMPNGEVFEAVANPPERSKDDTTISTKNGQLSRTGSLTVLKRTGSPRRTGSAGSRSLSQASVDSDYASVDLSNTEKLPPIDTPEASHVCSIRLRAILKKLHKGDISKEDLIKNLEYAASVLETVYIDETRRLCDEEDELSEVEPDAVPSEVRDWLALTFTRSMSNIKRRGGADKPKFRSVAHAIRAGIMVDRIYRRMSSTVGLHVPPNVLMLLKNMDDWSFDVFGLNETGDNHALKYVGYELLQRYDLINKFKINVQMLECFLLRVEEGYSKHNNPYHNLVHAADVTQTTHYLVSQSGLALWLTDLEMLATIMAAAIHDYEHTGTTNNFHINTMSDVAMLYNDRAVLENHHISAAFRLLKEDEFNILSGLKREEYRDFRGLVIDMVLATDMSFHFQQIKNMKNLLSMPEKWKEYVDNIDKSKALSLVLHCADISHPAKDWKIHSRWTESLLEEFFRQGDRESDLGLAYSPLCDRKNTLVAESQIGFIDFIVDPSFQVMGDMLEKIIAPLHQRPGGEDRQLGIKFDVKRSWLTCLHDNKTRWKERAAKDAAEREKAKKEAEATENNGEEKEKKKDEQADSGVESPNPAKDSANKDKENTKDDKESTGKGGSE